MPMSKATAKKPSPTTPEPVRTRKPQRTKQHTMSANVAECIVALWRHLELPVKPSRQDMDALFYQHARIILAAQMKVESVRESREPDNVQ